MSQMLFEGPVHVSWGIGERRREVVRRFGRRVKDWTLERRMASLPGGCCCDLPYPDERVGVVLRKKNRRMVKGVRYLMVQHGKGKVRSYACDDLTDPGQISKGGETNLNSTLSTTLTRSSPTAMG